MDFGSNSPKTTCKVVNEIRTTVEVTDSDKVIDHPEIFERYGEITGVNCA